MRLSCDLSVLSQKLSRCDIYSAMQIFMGQKSMLACILQNAPGRCRASWYFGWQHLT